MQYNPHPTRVYAGMGGGCPVGAWAPSIHSSKHELHAPAVHVVHRAPGGGVGGDDEQGPNACRGISNWAGHAHMNNPIAS